jgi:hypothetical protein
VTSLRAATAVLLAALAACHAPPSLQQQLEARLQGFRGTAGVYVRHLESGE